MRLTIEKHQENMARILNDTIEYEKRRRHSEACNIVTVEPLKAVMIAGVSHAGVVSHICTKPVGHTGLCVCCSYTWKGKK